MRSKIIALWLTLVLMALALVLLATCGAPDVVPESIGPTPIPIGTLTPYNPPTATTIAVASPTETILNRDLPSTTPVSQKPVATVGITAEPVRPAEPPTSSAQHDAGVEALAKESLIRYLGGTEDDIAVLSIEPATWPDSSLGCPQPGTNYLQVVTAGYRVVLEMGGQAYEVHTDSGQIAVLCIADQDSGDTGRYSPATGELPFFVGVLQAYLLSSSSPETSIAEMPPNDLFAFDAAARILLLRPSTAISPGTQVIVGLTTIIQSQDQTLTRGEVFQAPLSETGPIRVITVDTETGALTLAYEDQTFELLPGQSRSFKQQGDQPVTQITIITHAGKLAAIEPLPDAGGTR